MRLVFKYVVCFLFNFVSAEDIEYYPSQNALENQRIIAKRSIDNIKETKETSITGIESDSDIRWRHFMNETIKTKQNKIKIKRATDPVFYGHPKTREEIWNERFINESTAFDQTPSLIKLIHNITMTYLNECTPVILYDSQVKSRESYLFQNLLKYFPVTFIHGYIDDNKKLKEPKLLLAVKECLHYIVFVSDVASTAKVLGKQSDSRVVVVARSSQWAVQEFLSGPYSRMFINLLVIGQSFKDDDDDTIVSSNIQSTARQVIQNCKISSVDFNSYLLNNSAEI
jgi:hypothetical protein